jgi:hypothetical protein
MLYPVNNFDDAVAVANLHNITSLHLVSDFTIPASANLTGFHIVGEGRRLTTVSIDQDATLEECRMSSYATATWKTAPCSAQSRWPET